MQHDLHQHDSQGQHQQAAAVTSRQQQAATTSRQPQQAATASRQQHDIQQQQQQEHYVVEVQPSNPLGDYSNLSLNSLKDIGFKNLSLDLINCK